MTALQPSATSDRPAPDTAIRASMELIEQWLEQGSRRMFDPPHLEPGAEALRRLHASVRTHHSAQCLDRSAALGDDLPPEFACDFERLHNEHNLILGQLDRLIRTVDSILDRPLEDKEVFVLRIREIIAVLRRHLAEEDRLFFLAMWRDIGGEGG